MGKRVKSSKKRQTTRWGFTASFGSGTYIRVGYVFNKRKGVPEDVIRLQIVSLSERRPIDLQMRLDEAVLIASGLTKVGAQMLIGQLPQVNEGDS